jgi:ribosomal protein S18 acetylase RimI-like enzyme
MCFKLTGALIDAIVFSMEDQRGDFLLDTQEGILVGSEAGLFENNRDDGRYIELPVWDSSRGFRLMERFTAILKNPLIREELTAALDQGKGVFRAFKNALNRRPEAEKQWFAFKQQEMKREIIQWYNALCDERGLERIGIEPEETDDLVLEDFIFREPEAKDTVSSEELHRRILEDRAGDVKTPVCPAETVKGDLALIAETGGGDFAGYIAAVRKNEILYINVLEVKPEFRGLGIGEELCSRLLEKIDPKTISYISMDLPVDAEGFSRVLLRKSFKPYATRYYLNLNSEYTENPHEAANYSYSP